MMPSSTFPGKGKTLILLICQHPRWAPYCLPRASAVLWSIHRWNVSDCFSVASVFFYFFQTNYISGGLRPLSSLIPAVVVPVASKCDDYVALSGQPGYRSGSSKFSLALCSVNKHEIIWILLQWTSYGYKVKNPADIISKSTDSRNCAFMKHVRHVGN